MDINEDNLISSHSEFVTVGFDVSSLENALKEFRTKKSKKKNLPAYYIFNNEELIKLLEILPDSIECLENANILEPVKVKLHGQEIVDIIKNIKN